MIAWKLTIVSFLLHSHLFLLLHTCNNVTSPSTSFWGLLQLDQGRKTLLSVDLEVKFGDEGKIKKKVAGLEYNESQLDLLQTWKITLNPIG